MPTASHAPITRSTPPVNGYVIAGLGCSRSLLVDDEAATRGTDASDSSSESDGPRANGVPSGVWMRIEKRGRASMSCAGHREVGFRFLPDGCAHGARSIARVERDRIAALSHVRPQWRTWPDAKLEDIDLINRARLDDKGPADGIDR